MNTEFRNAATDLILRACDGCLVRNESSYWETLEIAAELLAQGRIVKARLVNDCVELSVVIEKITLNPIDVWKHL